MPMDRKLTVVRTQFGTSPDEFAEALGSGPPYIVRYQWAGGADARTQQIVTQAIAACFGVETLEAHQHLEEAAQGPDPLANRIRYAYWLLKIFELSLGFSRSQERRFTLAGREPVRISLRVDRSKYRETYDEF